MKLLPTVAMPRDRKSGHNAKEGDAGCTRTASASVAVTISGLNYTAGSDSFLVPPASECPWKPLRCERSRKWTGAAYDQDPPGCPPGAPRSCRKRAGQPRAEPGSVRAGALAS